MFKFNLLVLFFIFSILLVQNNKENYLKRKIASVETVQSCNIRLLKQLKESKLSQEDLERVFTELRIKDWELLDRKEQLHLKKFLLNFNESNLDEAEELFSKYISIREIKDPYSIHSILSRNKDYRGIKAFKESLDFYKIFVQSKTDEQILKSLKKWVKSESHGIIAFQYFDNLGSPFSVKAKDFLVEKTPYFPNAVKVKGMPGNYITYSFELETYKRNLITELYRLKSYSEEEWFKLDNQRRYELLYEKISAAYESTPIRVEKELIVPTSHAPPEIGPLMLEQDRMTMEFTHNSYEVNLSSLYGNYKMIQKIHGFFINVHTHLVFYIKENYDKIAQLGIFNKMCNDYTYLKNIVDGRYGNEFLRFPDYEVQRNLVDAPRTMRDLRENSYKTFGQGVRINAYGESTLDGFIKIGLEPRDVTDNIEEQKLYVDMLVKNIKNKSWEKLPEPEDSEYLSTLIRAKYFAETLAIIQRDYITDGDSELFRKIYQMAMTEKAFIFPNIYFEHMIFTNLFDGKLTKRELTKVEIKRLDELKHEFNTKFAKYVSENRNKSVEDLIVGAREIIEDWAQKAQLHRYYEGN